MAKTSAAPAPDNRASAKLKARVVDVGVTDAKQLEGTALVTVRATDAGYYGHRIRKIGEVFQMRMTGGRLGDWLVLASDAELDAVEQEAAPEEATRSGGDSVI